MSRVAMVSDQEKKSIDLVMKSGEYWKLPATLKTEEACIVSRRAGSTIRKACKDGALKASRFGGTWCINRDSLLKYAGLL